MKTKKSTETARPRLFVGGPLHGHRKIVTGFKSIEHSSEGLVEYTAISMVRQIAHFAEDETLERLVHQKLWVMLDECWYRKSMNHETMKEAVKSVEAMLTDKDWDSASQITESGEAYKARMKRIADLDKTTELGDEE